MVSALLLGVSLAAPPGAIEGGPSLALPHAQLGFAPGARLIGEIGLTDSVWLGAEGRARLPGSASVTLRGPELARPIEVQTGQSAWLLGARFGWTPGSREAVRLRLAGSLGVARLTQAVRGPAGISREGVTSPWLQPEAGVVVPVGPGMLTAALYASFAPTQLDTLGAGGSVVGLAVGWRMEFGSD